MQVYNGANNVRAARAVLEEKKQIDYLRPWHENKEHVYCSTSPDHASTIETYRPRACQSISLQLIRRFIYAIDSARTQRPAGITPSEEIDSFSFWWRRGATPAERGSYAYYQVKRRTTARFSTARIEPVTRDRLIKFPRRGPRSFTNSVSACVDLLRRELFDWPAPSIKCDETDPAPPLIPLFPQPRVLITRTNELRERDNDLSSA